MISLFASSLILITEHVKRFLGVQSMQRGSRCSMDAVLFKGMGLIITQYNKLSARFFKQGFPLRMLHSEWVVLYFREFIEILWYARSKQYLFS
jgi:hypothetical protein